MTTFSWLRSENANIGWAWLFQIVIRFMVHCIMPTNFRPQCDFLKFPNKRHLPGPSLSWKFSKFRGIHKNWLSKAIFNSNQIHGTVHYPMRKTTRLKSGWGFGQTNSPLSTARVLIDAMGLCLLRVSEVWRLFAPDLRRWINSFSGSDFKPRLVYKTWYFCYFFTDFVQQF